jgi:carbamoyl-phosphate synthase large subunit
VNILITSASRKVSLVRAFQSALLRSGGGNVIAVDASPYGSALYVANRRFLVAASTDLQFIEEVLEICRRENVALIIPTRDEELMVFAEARARFEADGVRVMVPQAETVQTCRDKLAFLNFCRARGFGVPRTYDVNEWSGPDFPLFVKPRFGKGGQGARRVESEVELRFARNDPEQWIVQECVDWPEYTVDLLADFEGRVISVVPRSRQLVVAGESYVSRTVHRPDLIAEAGRLATELRLVGHNTIQCFWDGEHAKFIEVNPRFGGASALGRAAGADTPAMLVRMTKGETLPAQVGQFEADLVMLRFTDDLFLNASRLMAPGEICPEIAGASVHSPGHGTLRAVLFDLDNTLYPEEQFVVGGFRAAAQFLAKHRHLETEALVARMLKILSAHGRGKVFNILLEELGIDSVVGLPTLLQVYRSHQPVLSLFPEAAVTLRALKDRGLRLGLVTDGMASVQRRKIAALGLESYMDVIVCTDELGPNCGKPSTIPFEVAFTVLDVEPQAAAYVADDVSKDFAGPNRLGMKTVQIRSAKLLGVGEKPPPSDPEYLPQITAESMAAALTQLEIVSRPAIGHSAD